MSDRSGHRQRLREQFLANAPGSQSDEALLELLLAYSIPRKDVKPIAKDLIKVFGSLSQILSAPSSELKKITGVSDASVVLLKVIDTIRSLLINQGMEQGKPAQAFETQQNLINNLPQKGIAVYNAEHSVSQILSKKSQQPDKDNSIDPGLSSFKKSNVTPAKGSVELKSQKASNKAGKDEEKDGSSKSKRKFQVCNGYLLEFDQLARVLNFLLENKDAKKINRALLMENTCLANRQLESLVSIGSAMGLIRRGTQTLTPIGRLIAQNDIFIESKNSLEWCHYVASGSERNLIWFEIFNHLLPIEAPLTLEGWMEHLRKKLAGQYTERTIGKHLHEEVRFVADAYLERNLKKLELLQQSSDGRLYLRRHTSFNPRILGAMIYDFGTKTSSQLLQVVDMASLPGSPAVVFGLDVSTFRHLVEGLHDRGWLRYETTHKLDQIRLKPAFSSLGFLQAYYENREPGEGSK